jgi:thiol-disulfide isomerase/thioredoxin
MEIPFVKIILVLFIATLLFYAIYVSYLYYTQHVGNVEKFEENNVKIALFFATWCGHCREFKESGKFQTAYQKINADDRFKGKVVFVEYDADLNKDLVNKYGIQGFPSILSIDKDGNKIADFTGDRYSIDDLVNFTSQTLKKNM